MTLPMFLAIAVVAAIAEYIWFRKARKARQRELRIRRVSEMYDLSPRDVAELKQLVEGKR